LAREIPLSRGFVAIVDDEDYAELSRFKWWADGLGYALTTIGGRNGKKNFRMHRMITGAADGMVVDHIDGVAWNNQRSNLRVVTQRENLLNSRGRLGTMSGYKGVRWYKQTSRWVAHVCCYGKYHHVGYFMDPIEAARAYNAKALELFGEFARLNVIPEEAA
jgi:hypothetical protein